MEIVNPGPQDYHVHSLNFSDGFSTIDEIAQMASRFGLTEIAITDHSQEAIDRSGLAQKSHRSIITRWENVYNDTNVIFGVEGDLLNEEGDICDHIQGKTGSFLILSMHHEVYTGDPRKVTEAYIHAIEKHGRKIAVLGHPFIERGTEHLDIGALTEIANSHGIPLELNCRYLVSGGNPKHLKIMLEKADRIYVNSDAHTLHELKTLRERGFAFLKEQGYIR